VSNETSVCLRTWKTELWLTVRAQPTSPLTDWLFSLLRDEVASLDVCASRFRADSQLSAVNRNCGTWTDVSWDFITVLTASLNAAAATDGIVDPLLGRQVVAAGYDAWAGQESGIGAQTSDARWQAIEIRPAGAQAQVRIPTDSALDLGAVAKGWLADRLATIAHRSTGFDAIANMGGDLRVVSPSRPWVVSAEPDVPGVQDTAMELIDAGLATSGLSHRSWATGHHLIDPRTAQPARTQWQSVSVLAAEAAGANAAATAGLILAERGPAWLADMGLDGWFVAQEDQQTVGSWPRSLPVGA
jgi:thiamine biosynthesis lipoprotein